MKTMSMQSEAERAIDVAKAHSPQASWWRGDVRMRKLFPGMVFNLVDDSNPNHHQTLGQFRAVTITAAPEGLLSCCGS